LYEKFKAFLDERGITAYKVSKGTGIAPAVFTDWKSGRSKPKIDKLIKIADFLGVDVKELIEQERRTD
jgi:transcriptional regulator with XRE-family HTH domain